MAERHTNGTTIASMRKQVGLKQVTLAAKADITPAYLSQIENGVRQPGLDVARRIANGLGVPLEAITYTVPDEAAS